MLQERITLCLGMTGCGKTYKFAEILRKEKRAICIDPTGDKNLEGWGTRVSKIKEATDLMREDEFAIKIWDPNIDRLEVLCHIAMKIKNVTIAVDELSLFCNPHWIGEEFGKVIRLGRHYDVGLIATTQQPADMHNLILSQATGIYLFKMTLPRHVDYLSKFIPNARQAITLPRRKFIYWSPSND